MKTLMGFQINIPEIYKEREDVFIPKILNAIQKNATGFWDSELKRTIDLAEIFSNEWDFVNPIPGW